MESAERASHYLAGYSGTGRRKCGSGQIHSGGSLLHEAGTLLEGRMGAREGPQSFIDNLRENTELFPFNLFSFTVLCLTLTEETIAINLILMCSDCVAQILTKI